MGATGPHFSDAELRCPGKTCSADGKHGCGVNGCQQSLIDVLEEFRRLAGKPVMVNDAYRCPVHNKEVGGAGKSQHMDGLAADIRVKGMTAVQLESIALRIPAIRGMGRDDKRQYIHIDVRHSPMLVKWCYRTNDQGVTTQVRYYSSPDAVINA